MLKIISTEFTLGPLFLLILMYAFPAARPENRDQLDSEIRKADVICIVYSIDRRETIERVSLFWLPYIRKLGRNVYVDHELIITI